MVVVVRRGLLFTSRASWLLAVLAAGAGCAGVHHQASDGGGGEAGAGGARADAGPSVAHMDAAPRPSDGPAPLDLGSPVVGGSSLGDAACAAQSQMAQTVPLDMYVMLDSSASMLEMTSTGVTKWDAIRAALVTFVNDPNSAGIGVGLQYFPLEEAGVPDSCAVDKDCGASGPCDILKTCAAAANVTACNQDSDCGRGDTCVPLGVCTYSTDPNVPEYCVPVGGSCGAPRGNNCEAIAGYCDGRDLCTGASYATPAVEVATLPGVATAVVGSLTQHEPDGLTPTSGALTGALTHATALAKQRAGHRVVVLLATDGLPSECTPDDIMGVSSISASALAATPSISTFVIGVFAPAEAQDAQTNLDSIAAAGGTKKSFVINLSQNVEQQFLAALTAVRTAALSCAFAVPTPPTGQVLNYFDVNVDFTSGAGQTVTIGNVEDKAACDPKQGGWYYDVDPSAGTPTNISVCDTSCTTLQADPAGRVEVLLGCKTQAIIP